MHKFGYRSETSRIVLQTEENRLVAVYSDDEQKMQTIRRFMIRDVWLPNVPQEKDAKGNPTEFF